jgi:DNA-binding NarL/FixJ family response regulator
MNFKDVNSLLAIDNPNVRRGLHDFFKAADFGSLTEVSSHVQLHQAVEVQVPDLIITAAELEGFFVGDLIAQIRNTTLGGHPFPVVVMLSPVAGHDYLKKVIDSGPDDVLLMPISPDQLLTRIRSLAKRRKPFVVTQDYTGPDRRGKHRPGGETIPLVDVPNPLHIKTKKGNLTLLQREIERASGTLNAMKLGRYVVQIKWLNEAILKMHRDDRIDPTLLGGHALRLRQVAEDVKIRASVFSDAAINALADALDRAAQTAGDTKTRLDDQGLETLSVSCYDLSQAITRLLPQ